MPADETRQPGEQRKQVVGGSPEGVGGVGGDAGPGQHQHGVSLVVSANENGCRFRATVSTCPSCSPSSPSVSTALGGVVALRSRDRLHLVLGFAAGVMLGLVAFDLLPELFELSEATFGGVPAVMVPSRPASSCCTSSSARWRCTAPTRASTARTATTTRTSGWRRPPRWSRTRSSTASASAWRSRSTTRSGYAVALAVIAHDFADGLNTVTVMRTHGNSHRRQVVMLGDRRASHRCWVPCRRCSSASVTTCWRCTSAASPASCSTSRPPTSSPRRTPGTRPGSPCSAPSAASASCGSSVAAS